MAGRKKGAPSAAARAKPGSQTHNHGRKQAGTTAQNEQDPKPRLSEHERRQQQRVLDVFRHAFGEVLSSPDLAAKLQSLKQALFDRDFARAFGDPEHLAVYAARWSPTRALCYASVLHGIWEHLETLLSPSSSSSSSPSSAPASPADTVQADTSSRSVDAVDDDQRATASSDHQEQHQQQQQQQQRENEEQRQLRVLSIGGGAAELVALAAFLNQQHAAVSAGAITLVDSGPWADVVARLTASLTTPPPLSKYASAAARQASAAALVSAARFRPTFVRQDALALGRSRLAALAGDAPLLVTMLFTLNELFTAGGVGKTTALLLALTCAAPAGSLLLVVDSPGSYSEASVGGAGAGGEKRRYPMQWLLDRILLGTRREPVGGRRWTKLEARESVWFRLADELLDYPIPLENMRYQMHLYRAEDAGSDEEGEEEE